jgi:hypothetical protein
MPQIFNVSHEPVVHAWGDGLVNPGESVETDAVGPFSGPWSIDADLAATAAQAWATDHPAPVETQEPVTTEAPDPEPAVVEPEPATPIIDPDPASLEEPA